MENTPSGSVWLIFCLYTLSADQRTEQGIYPTITHMERGEVETLFFRKNIAISYPSAKKKYFAVYVKDYLVKKLQLPFILV